MGKDKHSNDSEKKNFWKDKKNVAIVILSFLLLFSLGSTPNEDGAKLNNEISSLKSQINSLNEELEAQNAGNDVKAEELEKQIQDKETHIKNLETQINTLTEDNANLNSKVTELTEENSSLQAKKSVSTSTPQGQTTSSSQIATEDTSSSYTVYVTKTGGKYHRDGCRYLKSSKIAKDKSSAISQGYDACSVCNP